MKTPKLRPKPLSGPGWSSFFLLIVLLLFFSPSSIAQKSEWSIDIRAGANISLNRGIPKKNKKLKFPGMRLFASCILNKSFNKTWIGNYGGTLSFYTKSLGNDLSPLNNDIQIDFVSTLSWGIGWGDSIRYDKVLRTIHNAPHYNIKHSFENAFLVSSNIVLNNHKRFQTIGSFSGTFGNFSYNYSNDSGPGIEWLPISDNMDRWWSGIVGLFYHTDESFNRVEFSFDQFTGYSPLIYELTSLFGINIPNYSSGTNEKFTPRTFNASAYNLRVYMNSQVAFDLGVNGSLSYYSEKKDKDIYWSLQDALHIKRGAALHPGSHNNRLHFGIISTRTIHQEILE